MTPVQPHGHLELLVVYGFNRGEASVSRQPSFINLQQFYLEWFLVDRVSEIGAGEIRWNNKVTAIEPSSDGVDLTVETPAGSYRMRADWVVDATGANSPVRTHLGIKADAARHVDRWCICDVRCTDLSVPERWTWVDAPFNGGRAVWQHMMADDVWRLDYQLDGDDDSAEAARLDVAAARVREHLGPDVSFELVWVGPWQYRTQVLDRFRVGRVLFAGDAAHVMSPFGARGGNSSIQDAENLGWKLALVLSGVSRENLLDSYDAERRPAAVENIRVTSRTARFLAPQTGFERRLRQTVLALSREHAFGQALVNTGRLSLPNTYQGSPVIAAGGGFALPNVSLRRNADGEDVSLNDILRSLGTAVLGLYAPRAREDRNRAAISGIGGDSLPYAIRTIDLGAGAARCSFGDLDGVLAGLTGLEPGGLVVVRPDLYVAGLVREATPAAAEALLAQSAAFRGA